MRSSQALLPGATFEAEGLSAPDAAIAAFLAALALAAPPLETASLELAAGRILAADAVAREPYPADPRSTMDGFAVRSADGDAVRRIAGDIRMGQAPPGPIGPGEAMRIPTGGVLPDGADAVVPIEDADVTGETIVLRQAAEPGAYVTQRGDDLAPGTKALAAGRRIGGPELSVLATLGITAVPVYRRPRIAICSTGDELIDAGTRPQRGQIRDSNRWAIAGALVAMGAEPVHLERAPDELAALTALLAAGLAQADAVILTGGSSVGERDLTPEAIEALPGGRVIVHGLWVKPGKPTVFAVAGGKPVIGLPGNPTSALTILEAVCKPVIAALTGEADYRPNRTAARAGAAFTGRPGWTWYVPVELRAESHGNDVAFPLALRSAHTSLLARSHGYVVLGPELAVIPEGAPVTVVHFSGGGRP